MRNSYAQISGPKRDESKPPIAEAWRLGGLLASCSADVGNPIQHQLCKFDDRTRRDVTELELGYLGTCPKMRWLMNSSPPEY